jgi:oligopeptide transport system substrate-binding protein
MIRRAIYLLLSAVFLIILAVGGCGTTTPSIDVEGQVLYLSGNDPYSLDPAVSGDASSNTYIIQIYSGLVRLDENLMVVPDIADSWKTSNGGCTYTFYLREDVYFHDGKPVMAEDFYYSWRRAVSPDTGSQTALTYLGDIVGVKEVVAGVAGEISGVKVIDDYTLEVTIDEPRSYFLLKMAFVTAYVVDRENVESSSDWWRRPNGTGPFKLDEWSEGSFISLQRNELYYQEPPKVDFVVFRLLAGRPVDLYETGAIDISPVNMSYIDRVRDESSTFYSDLVIFPELSFYYLGFNLNEPPFDDVDIRRAFSMALDRQILVELVYLDTVEPAEGILPPGIPGYNEDLTGIPYDVERARQLIVESSYGDVSNLPPITITTLGWGGLIAQELEAIVHQWRVNLGVEVLVRQIEPQRYLYNLAEEIDQIYYSGWIADYAHPHNFLEVLFGSGADSNWGGYSNSMVDFLLYTADVAADNEQSLELYRQAEQILVNDAACWPFWFGQNYVLVRSYVNGYYQNALGMPVLVSVSIESH